MGTLLSSHKQKTHTHNILTMNRFLFFSSLLAVSYGDIVPAALPLATGVAAASPYLVRAPAHDSASIEHHRLGGNFAYSTAESHAFAEVTPQISTLTHPVAETIKTHIPAKIATHQPAPTVRAVAHAAPVAIAHAAAPVALAHAAPIAHAAAPIAVAHAEPAALSYAAGYPLAHAGYAGL